jgi:hypothetical protein
VRRSDMGPMPPALRAGRQAAAKTVLRCPGWRSTGGVWYPTSRQLNPVSKGPGAIRLRSNLGVGRIGPWGQLQCNAVGGHAPPGLRDRGHSIAQTRERFDAVTGPRFTAAAIASVIST